MILVTALLWRLFLTNWTVAELPVGTWLVAGQVIIISLIESATCSHIMIMKPRYAATNENSQNFRLSNLHFERGILQVFGNTVCSSVGWSQLSGIVVYIYPTRWTMKENKPWKTHRHVNTFDVSLLHVISHGHGFSIYPGISLDVIKSKMIIMWRWTTIF